MQQLSLTRRTFLAGLVAAVFLLAGENPASAKGKTFLTVEEALALAFPECRIERPNIYLTKKQEKAARKLAKCEITHKIVRPYHAYKEGRRIGTAYFDTHRVRTMKETLMVVVDTVGRVERIEVLAFGEPEDYIPRGNWYAQFLGQKLDEKLTLKREIRGVTGATLTARATTDCVRRVLALHQVVEGAVAEGASE